MSQWEHARQDGHLAAMRQIQQAAQDDLKTGKGEIKPARTIYAYYDSKLHSVSRWITEAAGVLPFRKRA